jgi:hypothetical protein
MNLNCPLAQLAKPANWFQRALCRHLLADGRNQTVSLLRVRVIASILYFGAAALAVGIAMLLVAINALLGASYF